MDDISCENSKDNTLTKCNINGKWFTPVYIRIDF